MEALRLERPDDHDLLRSTSVASRTSVVSGEARTLRRALSPFGCELWSWPSAWRSAAEGPSVPGPTCELPPGRRNFQFSALNRASKAGPYFHRANDIRSELDPSKLPGLIQNLAISITNEGMIYGVEGRRPDAEKAFRRAEAVLRKDASGPENLEAGAVLAYGHLMVNWGEILLLSQRLDESVDRTNAGLERVEAYLRKEPSDAAVKDLRLPLHGNRALAFSEQKKHRESAGDWAHVVELSGQRVPVGYRIHWAIELLKAGDMPRAAAQVQLVKPEQVVNGEDRYNLGSYYALTAPAAKNSTRIAPDQRASVGDSHIEDALRWLKLAADAGFFNDPTQRDNALKDPDLTILYDNPDFRRLIEPAKQGR